MILGRVTGSVHATLKNQHLIGYRLLVVRALDLSEMPTGQPLICIDRVDAGKGDKVVVTKEGGGVRILLKNNRIPIQAMVVAIVDGMDREDLR
jgi:ethanolamine utilization protein EutN